jgi:hypothetical protein
VTEGVKNAAMKFAYRIEALDRVIEEQGVQAAF